MSNSLRPHGPQYTSLPVYHKLPEFTQTHVHWVGDDIQPSHPLSSPSPPALNLSQHQGLFKWVALCIRWPKDWSFSFTISPSSGYSGLIPFRMDWLDRLAVQGTLKSLLQHHSSRASILQRSAFFMVQLSQSLSKCSANCSSQCLLSWLSMKKWGRINEWPFQPQEVYIPLFIGSTRQQEEWLYCILYFAI